MAEGTVTISIKEHDRLRLMDEAVANRMVVKTVTTEHGYGLRNSQYFLLSESEANREMVQDLERCINEVIQVRRECENLRCRLERITTPKEIVKKWWQI